MWLRECWWYIGGCDGRFATWPSSCSPSDSSSDDAGDKEGRSWAESSEKSSIEAGSDGEVTLSPDTSGDSAADCCEDVPMVASRFGGLSLLRVGKFGVDLL